MHLIGVDQSLTSPGIAVIDYDGKPRLVTNLKNNLKGVERLAYIRDQLALVLKTFKPEFAALEGYSVNSVNRPFDLGEVGGLVRLALHDAHVPFIVVTPTQLKKFVTGSGASDKEALQKWVAKKWEVTLTQDDQADAFGLAQVARVFSTKATPYRSELEVVMAIDAANKKVIRTLYAKSRTKVQI